MTLPETPSSSRTIHLRRPPILSVVEGVYVPAGDAGLLDEVEARWAACCKENPAYFDGRLYHVLGVHRNGHGGASIHVIDCAYRFHAVQDDAFDLGMRALGVKGITRRDGLVLMGKRSQHVHAYRGMWEFTPGGVAEIDSDPAVTIVAELEEETGLLAMPEPIPIAVMYDNVLRSWEIVFRIDPASGSDEPVAAPEEYDELRWCSPDALPDDLSPIARQMTSLLERTC